MSGLSTSLRPAHSLALLALLGACGGPVHRPDGGDGMLGSGSVAPDFVATDATGHAVQLAGTRGAPSVVYFYPKDETPGCTKEACAFRDAWDQLAAAHVSVFGVSHDSAASHALFQEKFKLPFPLAADPDGTISRAYGVRSTLGMAERVTFLVGPDGRIAKVYPNVDPAVHVAELLRDVAKLP